MPSTILALAVAIAVNRLNGWLQSIVLAAFFLPYILPVSVVYRIWSWMFDKDFGVAQYAITPFTDGQHVSIFRTLPLFMPAVAFVTVWWLLGFNVLLFVAGLRNILDRNLRGLRPRRRRPLGAVPAHHLAADLAGDGAGADDPAHPATEDFRSGLSVRQQRAHRCDDGDGPVHSEAGFQMNKGGLAAAASVVLFVLIVALSVLQFQLLRARGAR